MAFTLKELGKILSAVKLNDELWLEQIKENLKNEDPNMYKEWKEDNGFYIDHKFNTENGKFSLLHIAVITHRFDLVQYLIDKEGADINVKDSKEKTPLHLIFDSQFLPMNNLKELVEYFIGKKEINVNLQDSNGNIPLHLAIHNQFITADKLAMIVRCFINKKGSDVDLQDSDNVILLHCSALNRYFDIVQYLIDKKRVDINVRDSNGRTPLHCAAFNGHLDTVRYLVEDQKVSLDKQDSNGRTPLHCAAFNGHLDTVRYLVEDQKVSLDKQDSNGRTPLHCAALNGRLDTVRYLIEQEADIYVQDNNGKTPLYLGTYCLSNKSPLHSLGMYDDNAAHPLIARTIELQGSNVKKPKYLREALEEYWNKCLDEIKKIEQKEIDLGTMLYDILVNKGNKLLFHIQKEGMKGKLEKIDYANEFPIYGIKLKRQFEIGKQRLDALSVGKKVIKHFSGSRGISDHCMEIAKHLSNKDMQNLRKAGIQTMEEKKDGSTSAQLIKDKGADSNNDSKAPLNLLKNSNAEAVVNQITVAEL